MKKIKIAIFSLTSCHSVYYMAALPTHKDYELVAVSVEPQDRLHANLNLLPKGIKIYDNEEELLNNHNDLDAVVLAGANFQTFSLMKLCISHGIKNILAMKVPTFDMEEYSEMQRLVKENGVVLQVELEMRFEQTVRRIKELCSKGFIGKINSVQIYNTTVCMPPALLPWITVPEKSYGKRVPLFEGSKVFRGGALTDHPHAFDLARYFTDSEFESVYAEAAKNIRPEREVEDGIYILGKMKNGISVSIDPSYSRHENDLPPLNAVGPGWEGYPKRVEVNVIINGEKGSIIADCFHSGIYHTGLPRKVFAVQYIGGSDHYSPSLDAFAECVRTRKKPVVNLDMHRKTIEAMSACYESVSTGKPVSLRR